METVAPHAGAWIETSRPHWPHPYAGVAPHAGAWIETGLPRHRANKAGVAPHAGAWIETVLVLSFLTKRNMSHPTRVRGLKLRSTNKYFSDSTSHPTRVRGLKQLMGVFFMQPMQVAPHAGAWIETLRYLSQLCRSIPVAPHAGAWIETELNPLTLEDFLVAPHAGAWIETRKCSRLPPVVMSRTPRGCVD